MPGVVRAESSGNELRSLCRQSRFANECVRAETRRRGGVRRWATSDPSRRRGKRTDIRSGPAPSAFSAPPREQRLPNCLDRARRIASDHRRDFDVPMEATWLGQPCQCESYHVDAQPSAQMDFVRAEAQRRRGRGGGSRGVTPCLPLGHSQWADIRSGPTLPASSAPLREQFYLKDANRTPVIIRSWTSALLPPEIMQKTRKAQSSDAPMERRTRKTALREGQNRKAVPRYTAWLLRRSSSRRARRSRSER